MMALTSLYISTVFHSLHYPLRLLCSLIKGTLTGSFMLNTQPHLYLKWFEIPEDRFICDPALSHLTCIFHF